MRALSRRQRPSLLSFIVFAIAFSVPFLVPSVGLADDGPTLTLQTDGVEVSSLSSGSRIAVLGVLRRPLDYSYRVEVVDRFLEDADGDGVVTVELPEGLPERTAWVVLDLSSGDSATLTTGIDAPFTAADPTVTVDLAAGSVTSRSRMLSVLVGRPGSESAPGDGWFGFTTDGGALDADGYGNGSITILSEEMSSLTDGDHVAAPASFARGDVVAGIDARTLEIWVQRPGAEETGEGGAR